MKIGVLAGTPQDTRMGVDYITSQGYETCARICCDSPEEQMKMQVLHKDELTIRTAKLCAELEEEGADGIFINCNSLSAAVNLARIRAACTVKVVTPLDVYVSCGKKYRTVGVVAANGQCLAAIEKTIMSDSPECNVFGAALRMLVIAIERLLPPDQIWTEQKLQGLFESMEAAGAEALILGCTHFPYIADHIRAAVSIPVLDPGRQMLELLLS